MFARKLTILVFVVIVILVPVNNTKAKSVCAITDHGLSTSLPTITAYGIEGDSIYEQYVYELDYPQGFYLGPVGITSGDGYLFVTHENTGSNGINGIQFINARTMLDQGVLEVTDSPDFAGIVYDSVNDRIYAMKRNSNKLYIFSWNSSTQTLTELIDSPVTLDEIGIMVADWLWMK
jgi:hypothetical protein